MIMNSYATFHDLWTRIRIHVSEQYREIISGVMGTNVPDVFNASNWTEISMKKAQDHYNFVFMLLS